MDVKKGGIMTNFNKKKQPDDKPEVFIRKDRYEIINIALNTANRRRQGILVIDEKEKQ